MSQQPATLTTHPRNLANVPLIITALLMVDSLHFVFARMLLPYLPGGTSAMYVLAVATVELAIFLGLRGKIRLAIFRENLVFFLTIGFLVAMSTTLNYTAVGFIDPGTASLLAQTNTLFALVFSLVWLRERLTRRELIGAISALAGVFAISFQPGDYLRSGSLLVLSGAFMYSLHAAVVKRHGGELDFGNFFFWRVASTTGFLLLFTNLRGQLLWPSLEAWKVLILTGTVDVIISRTLYYIALRRLKMSIHTVILTLSPVITILWSLFLFGDRPTVQALIGGVGVISGVAILSRRGTQEEKSENVGE